MNSKQIREQIDKIKQVNLSERYGEDFEQMPDPAVESVLNDFFNYVSDRLGRGDKISKSHLKSMIDDFVKLR